MSNAKSQWNKTAWPKSGKQATGMRGWWVRKP